MATVRDVGETFAQQRRCIQTARSTGRQCENHAAAGSPYCGVHGANGRRRKKQAAFNAVDEFAKLYDPDAPAITDPVAELQRLGSIARNALNVAGQKVNELQSWQSVDAKGTAQLRVEIQLWVQMATRSESILTTLAKLGLDERRVQLAEREAEAVVALLDTVRDAAELQLSAAQRQAWDTVVDRELAAITAE